MKVYAGALEKSAEDDITLIAGDLVPIGNAHYYGSINELTESIAHNDIYVLRGNHDTGEYTEYYGRKNYALIAKDFSVVVLDNAMRTFEEEGLELLKQVLEMEEVRQVIVAFHIPVPNHFIRNSVSEEEFSRLKEAYSSHKDKVKYLLCGHVHSRFEDVVDDIPLICTGGGGALIEDVSEDIRACDVEHHIVHFYLYGSLNSSCGFRPPSHAVRDEKRPHAPQAQPNILHFFHRFHWQAPEYILHLQSNGLSLLGAFCFLHLCNRQNLCTFFPYHAPSR